jgi:hypothetical protein
MVLLLLLLLLLLRKCRSGGQQKALDDMAQEPMNGNVCCQS